jgi:CHAD domain-containing protein
MGERTNGRGGKWIAGMDAETPADRAARHVLALRLDVVRERLPAVLEEIQSDTEDVHQLRVATRRADAGLRIFRDYLPGKVFRRARWRLRRLRRAAGAARDWDVFAAEVAVRMRRQPAAQRPGLEFLHGYAAGRRSAAQEQLTAAATRELTAMEAFLEGVLTAVHPAADNPERTLLQLAAPLLRGLLHEFEEAAAGDLTDYAHLHQVRIAGKRLRYAMEIFACGFPPLFVERLYPEVEQIQEILGRANDSHVAAGHLEAVRRHLEATQPKRWPVLRPGIEVFLKYHRRRLPQERRRFLDAWKNWQAPDLRAVWALLLGEPAVTAASPAV